MTPEEYLERTDEIDGWPVTIISYKLGDLYHAKVENNFTRGWTTRASASTRDEALQKAIDEARVELARTRRLPLT
jgi:hypothetical protein